TTGATDRAASLPTASAVSPTPVRRHGSIWERRAWGCTTPLPCFPSRLPPGPPVNREPLPRGVCQSGGPKLGAQPATPPAQRLPRLAEPILCKGDRLGFALHVDADAVVGAAIDNAVLLHPVAVRGERLAALGAEEHPHLATPRHVVVTDEVVRVAVADR